MAHQSFEDLSVWQRGLDLSVRLYKPLENCRKFSLRDQIERSGLSIPSNIAEGQERDSQKEFIRFLRIAKGSSGELRTQLLVAERIQILDSTVARELIQETKEISAMLQGLIRSIENRLKA